MSGAGDAAGALMSSIKMRLFEVIISLNCSGVRDITHPFSIVSPCRGRGLSPGLRADEESFEQYKRSASVIWRRSIDVKQSRASIF